MSPATPEARYVAPCEAFFAHGDVSPSEKSGFGASALTIEGRILAMLTRGRLVVKLPRARVDANRGASMKEWLTVDPAHEADWRDLAEEALRYLGGAKGKRG